MGLSRGMELVVLVVPEFETRPPRRTANLLGSWTLTTSPGDIKELFKAEEKVTTSL